MTENPRNSRPESRGVRTSLLRGALLLGIGVPLTGALAFPTSPVASARSLDSAPRISLHVVFKGSYNHAETLRAIEHVSAKAPDADSMGCLVLKHGAVTEFFVHVQVNSGLLNINSASITIDNYRSSVTRYGASSTHGGTGARMDFEVIPPLHFYSNPSVVRLQLSHGGKSGTFSASRFPVSAVSHAAGETVTGAWTCSQVKTVRVP